MLMQRKLVGYYRVSTKRQGASGLGLESQENAVAGYAVSTDCRLIASYTEVESGRHHDRPELLKAIARAKREKATLCIAKMDRLSRNLAFIANLMETGVDFVAVDNANVNRLTIHVLAAVAEDEVNAISQRIKDALAVAKAHGKVLGAARPGAPQLSPQDRAKGNAAAGKSIRKRFVAAYSDLTEIMNEMQCDGLSLRAIAARLNDVGQTTRRGNAWNPSQVQRVLSLVG